MRLFQGTREDFPYGSAVASVQIAIFAVFWSKTRGHCAKSRKSMVLNFRSSPIQGPVLYQFLYAVREERIVYYISGKHTSALSSDHRFEIFLRKYKTPSKNTRTAESRLLKRFVSKLVTLLCPASRFGPNMNLEMVAKDFRSPQKKWGGAMSCISHLATVRLFDGRWPFSTLSKSTRYFGC